MNTAVYTTEPCFCARCGNPLGGICWSTTDGIICQTCIRRERKLRRKRRNGGGNTVPSKPMRPGRTSGYTFRPDQMPCASERFKYHYLHDGRIKWNDRQLERQYRKRQRRVDAFIIAEQLSSLENSDAAA